MSTVTLSEAKTQLARLLREVEELGERYVITRSGRAAGVLLSVDEYEGLLETLEILADTRGWPTRFEQGCRTSRLAR